MRSFAYVHPIVYSLALIKSLWRPEIIITIFLAFSLLPNYIFYEAKANPKQYRSIGDPVICILLLILTALNVWLHLRESKLTILEVLERAYGLVNQMKKYGVAIKQVNKINLSWFPSFLCCFPSHKLCYDIFKYVIAS